MIVHGWLGVISLLGRAALDDHGPESGVVTQRIANKATMIGTD